MPLVIVAGKPCTGKTNVANSLVEFLKQNGAKNVELVNEEYLNISKADGYKSSFDEKNTRGSIKSAADHKMNADCFLVVDSLNYIKGYRYQLYCSARTFRTAHCVLWVACPDSTSNEWNQKRIAAGGDAYEPAIMEELRRRFEAPNEQNRWDAPLFRVASVSVPTKGAESAGPTEDDHSRAELILNRFSSGGGDGDMKSGKPEEVYSDKNEHCCQPAGDASEPGASAFVSISAGSTVTTATTAIHSTAAVTGPSSFKTSWRPKLKKVTKDSSGNGALGAVAGGGDSESVFSFAPSVAATAATATGGQQISFSGTVVSTQEDALASGFEPPSDALFQQIFDYLQGAVAPPPNSSTLSNQRANADLLYELDRTSQKILQTIVAHQSQQTDWSEGTPMRFLEFDRALTLHRHVGLAELQRYRRQFVQINGRNPPTSSKAIGTSFIDFLASQL